MPNRVLRASGTALLCLLISPGALLALDMREAVRRVLEHDTTVQRATLARTQAEATRALLIGGLYPQVAVSATSPYALYQFSRTTPPVIPPATEASPLDTHQAGAQLVVSQFLPTDGSLSLALGNATTIRKLTEEPEDEDTVDPTVSQSLALSATLSQPLFTNGRIIDLRIYGLAKRLQADIPVERARLGVRSDTNTRIVDTLDTYTTVVYLRGSVANLEARVAHAARRLEQATVRSRQGTITQRDLWDAELELDQLKDALLEARFGLVQAEERLGWSLAREDLSTTPLGDQLPGLPETPDLEALTARLVGSSPEVAKLELTVEEARIAQTLGGREYAATLSATFALSPQYAADREAGGELGASYADLFAEEATWNTSLTLGLSVPVYQGGRARHQRERDAAGVAMAEVALRDLKETLRQSARSLYLERQMLEERLKSRMSSLSLEQERQKDRERLLQLERITQLDVEEGATMVAGKELEAWYAGARLFLNGLKILSLAGEDLGSALGG